MQLNLSGLSKKCDELPAAKPPKLKPGRDLRSYLVVTSISSNFSCSSIETPPQLQHQISPQQHLTTLKQQCPDRSRQVFSCF
jgi:hypothetical protein